MTSRAQVECSSRRCERRHFPGVVAALTVALALGVLASPAFAAQPLPVWIGVDRPHGTGFGGSSKIPAGIRRIYLCQPCIHQSRTGSRRSLRAEWHAEYASAEADGEPPAAVSPAWAPAGGGIHDSPGSGEARGITIGNVVHRYEGRQAEEWSWANQHRVLHHLAPDTTYYARFVVNTVEGEPEGGKAQDTIEFTTTAAGKPEIGGDLSLQFNEPEHLQQGPLFALASADFYATLQLTVPRVNITSNMLLKKMVARLPRRALRGSRLPLVPAAW